MAWLERFANGRLPVVRPGLPPKLLRHLLFSHELGIGSRVLAAGPGWGDLVRFFDHLGIDAVELGETADDIAPVNGVAPAVLSAGDRFDVVLSGPANEYQVDLFSPAALRMTADLLARIRPSGYLVLLAAYGSDEPAETPDHTLACYRRHLAAFPGSLSTRSFADRLPSSISWRRLLSRRSCSGFLTATIQLPEQTLPRSGLRHLADAAAQSASGPCCRPAAESAGLSSTQRKAA